MFSIETQLAANKFSYSSQRTKSLRQKWPEASPAAIARLVGSDYDARLFSQRASLLNDVLEAESGSTIHKKAFDELVKLSRKQAYKLFSALPWPLLKAEGNSLINSDLSASEIKAFNGSYIASAYWLLNWELELGLDDFIRRDAPYSEIRARVAELRYQMIRELCSRGEIPFPRPGFPWLLAEIAACASKLHIADIGIVTSKREAYERQKEYIDTLKKLRMDKAESYPPEALQETIWHIHEKIDLVAHDLAQTDKVFKRLYFDPYTKAKRTWNGKTQKLDIGGIQHRKSGPNLGKKYHKDKC